LNAGVNLRRLLTVVLLPGLYPSLRDLSNPGGPLQTFPGRLWQRNYYEQIIRNEDELNRLCQYILDNPANWETDEENPNRIRM
jgi:REP element-mobilizing transposase RayT